MVRGKSRMGVDNVSNAVISENEEYNPKLSQQ